MDMPVGVPTMEELFKCTKCRQKYDLLSRRPKLMVCHHCFCMQCIQSLIKTKSNQTAACPTCRKTTCIGRNGVTALPDNEYIIPHIKINNKMKREASPQDYRDSDIFHSDSEEEDFEFDQEDGGGFLDEASGGMSFINGSAALIGNVASPSCLTQHQISNYEHGVHSLLGRLNKAVQQAGENLTSEVYLLEESCSLLNRVQNAWTKLGQILDQTVIAQTMALSSAKSLLDKLPDGGLGLQTAKAGDPSILAKAVTDSEETMINSSNRLHHTKNVSNIWKAISSCNVNVQTPVLLPLNSDGTLFPIELNDRTKEDIICLMFSLSRMLESRLSNNDTTTKQQQLQPQQPKQVVPNVKENNYDLWANNVPTSSSSSRLKNHSEFQVVTTTKKVVKPLPMGFAYCYFDLMQGHAELGRVIFEINVKAAPKMAKNFIELCTGKHGFGYLNTKLWKTNSGEHVDGGDIPEGGDCSVYDRKPFYGDPSTLQDGLGMLRMRGRGTAENGQPIVGCQFMIWIRTRNFKSYQRTLIFGRVKDGLELLCNMPETRPKKKGFVPPVTIIKCGLME
ncbi:hypothetical protein B566_EDAN005001 [Ephemera danica]|nr:hypothetical protein B566_EDAN005001 [Ephemera danica]